MKILYVTSVERHSGKTAICLALAKHFQAAGYRVGYFKPLSLQPWRVAGRVADEDAAFAKEVLELAAEPWDISPVVLTPAFLRAHMSGETEGDLMAQVRAAFEAACAGQDVLVLEGGGSLREGYVVGLPTPAVAANCGGDVLALVKYRDEVRVLDDALAAHTRLGKMLCGIIINRVPPDAMTFVFEVAVPYLERQGIPVFGVLPEVRSLEALMVSELVAILEAQVLTEYYSPEAIVETLTVGAMTSEAALSRFRKQTNKAVITSGDRADIQLAALETSTTCLILTCNLHPSPLIIKQAEEFNVAVLLVRTNTLETVEAIERIFGKTRLGQVAKLQKFEALLAEHVDLDRLCRVLHLERRTGSA
ncbi:MAG: phosphotransacetylase family protein [Anaerolineae bacterium]|nr:phosphotransacetylase family protein [Anaerolineae bacterium]